MGSWAPVLVIFRYVLNLIKNFEFSRKNQTVLFNKNKNSFQSMTAKFHTRSKISQKRFKLPKLQEQFKTLRTALPRTKILKNKKTIGFLIARKFIFFSKIVLESQTSFFCLLGLVQNRKNVACFCLVSTAIITVFGIFAK